MSITNLVSKIIAINKDRQTNAAEQLRSAGTLCFAKEYQTVSVNVGRQSGHTQAITDLVTDDDLIITSKGTLVSTFRTRIYERSSRIALANIPPEDKVQKKYDAIWIDGATYISDSDKETIFSVYAGKCNMFVLVG